MAEVHQEDNTLSKLYAFVIALVLVVFSIAAWYADVQGDRHFQSSLDDIQLMQQAKQQLLQQEAERQLELAVDLIAADQQLQQWLRQAAERYQQQGSEADLTPIRQALLPILNGYWQKMTPYGASQLHLHLAPDAFTLLRAHRPERHSDKLINIRPLIMHSINNAARVTGTELGVHGLGLRAVVPVLNSQGETLAVIELGFDLQNVFSTRQEYIALRRSSMDSPPEDIALLVKPDVTSALHNDVKANWLHTDFWSSPSQDDMLQFWLDNKLIPEHIDEPQQITLSFNQQTFAVSLLPWPVWGQNTQQNRPLISVSWHDISQQLSAQQHTDKITWLIWALLCLITLALGVLLVAFLQRQARREVSQQQTLLKQSEQKLSALYQLSPLPILLNRFSDGTFIEANPAITQLTGYSIDEIQRLSYWDLTPESYAEAEQQQLKSLTETGRYGPYVKHYKHKNGELIDIELNGVLFNDGQGERYIWTIIQDIREIKRVEKLKDDFVSTVSHELRTPLTSIAGSLGLVLGGASGALTPKAERLLSIAHKNSQRLNILINDLLDINKLMAGKMRFNEALVSLPHLLQEAVEQNQPYAKQHDSNITLVNAPQVPLLVDAARIHQVLSNFLSNAIKFSPANTEVRLNADVIDDRVRISVHDQGPGIAISDQHRLFQRFSQLEQHTAQVKSGTGLGLAISREIVLRSGGEIGVNSELGQGATFWLELPIYRATSPTESR